MRSSGLLFSVSVGSLCVSACCALLGALAGCGQLADVPDHGGSADGGPSTSPGTSGGLPSTPGDPGPPDSGIVVKVDSGTTRSAGRCAKDADCGAGGHCVELVTGGFRVCSYPPPAAQACQNGQPSADECCGTCSNGGTCTLHTSCGGAFIEPYNICAVDECTANADCGPTEICLPTGVGSGDRRTCMTTTDECLRPSDCKAAPDGVCALIGTIGPSSMCAPWACGATSGTQAANGLRCIYANECSDDADCPKGHCEANGAGRPTCQPGTRSQCPPPP